MRVRIASGATSAVLAVVFGVLVPAAGAQSPDCTNLPAPDPTKTFVENFLHPCYAIRLPAAQGHGRMMTDPDQWYGGFFYHVNPRYELIVIGEFPKSRTLSLTIDDSHFSNQDWFTDSRLTPLRAEHVNPFQPGVPFVEDQLYAVTVSFGGVQPDPSAIAPGCGLAGLDFQANVLDASKRHPGMSWNTDPRVPSDFPPHDDVGPNTGGLLTVRQYIRGDDLGRLRLAWPVVIARDLQTGCAVPALQVMATDPENVLPEHLLTRTEAIAESWVDPGQMKAHEVYRDHLPPLCYTYAPPVWMRPHPYIPLPNPDAKYMLALLHPDRVAGLISAGGFMRLRFRVPTLPSIPCDGCVLSGTEELRYLNLSFFDSDRNTLASLGDFEIARDLEGFATVIVGFGAERPPDVTKENFYTYVDLSTAEGFDKLALIGLRMLAPSEAFSCSPGAVHPLTAEDNSLGGTMGEYAPLIDFVPASALEGVAMPAAHPKSCGVVPPEPLAVCPFFSF